MSRRLAQQRIQHHAGYWRSAIKRLCSPLTRASPASPITALSCPLTARGYIYSVQKYMAGRNTVSLVCQQRKHVLRQFSRTLRLWHLFLESFLAHFRLAHLPVVSRQNEPVPAAREDMQGL